MKMSSPSPSDKSMEGADPPAASSVRRRLVRGFGASAMGPVVTALVQLVSVPVFLRFWGAHLYGEWMVLSAIPTYLSLSDTGFGSVAGDDMTMRVARGDRAGAHSRSRAAAIQPSRAISILTVSTWITGA